MPERSITGVTVSAVETPTNQIYVGQEQLKGVHPASAPKEFSDEELAWACLLFQGHKWWSKHALKLPPAEMREYAQALQLTPLRTGYLFEETRAARLIALVELMPEGDRTASVELAEQRLREWRAKEAPPVREEEQLLAVSSGEHPSSAVAALTWRLPLPDDVFPINKETQKIYELPEERHVKGWCRGQEKMIRELMRSFRVAADVLEQDTCTGPKIVRFGIRPTGKPEMRLENGRTVPVTDADGEIMYEERTPISKIMKFQNDIALRLEAKTIRMEAPVPGRPYVGVEVPSKYPHLVPLRTVLTSKEFWAARGKMRLPMGLGMDVAGQIQVADLAKWPHVLIAGATGSGKSVCLNTLIGSILTQQTPNEVRMLMVDPKMAELMIYQGIPHLLSDVVTKIDQVDPLLRSVITEMEQRYQQFSQLGGVRNLDRYNQLSRERAKKGDFSLKPLPRIVIIIDELADLMMNESGEIEPKEIEQKICRIAQLGRAAGIHLVIATQRPSVDVVTGLIKANLKTRIAFMVNSAVDSRTIIDMGGAERLLGQGDMLYKPEEAAGKPLRLQGTYLSDEDTERLVEYWLKEKHRRESGIADEGFKPGGLQQQEIAFDWSLPEIEPEEEEPQDKKKDITHEMEQSLLCYLADGVLQVDGTPLPFPFSKLGFEDMVFVAEALVWKGERGSATNLDMKLKTSKGALLRNALVTRGHMEKDTQQTKTLSDRLETFLIESGLIDSAAPEAAEEDKGDAEEAPVLTS